jgi:hypothetical protein
MRTPRPRLLDLFCKAGGATRGYQLAGFHVTGVDIEPQPHYVGDAFILADALEVPLDGYDAIHASPPCHDHTALSSLAGKDGTGWLLDATRRRVQKSGQPWVIENVIGAPMGHWIYLCGEMFGLRTARHRQLETSWLVFQPEHHWPHKAPTSTKKRRMAWDAGHNISITGDVGVYVGRLAMGIDWMTGNELSQAIPPAYTRFIGEQLLAHLGVAA